MSLKPIVEVDRVLFIPIAQVRRRRDVERARNVDVFLIMEVQPILAACHVDDVVGAKVIVSLIQRLLGTKPVPIAMLAQPVIERHFIALRQICELCWRNRHQYAIIPSAFSWVSGYEFSGSM